MAHVRDMGAVDGAHSDEELLEKSDSSEAVWEDHDNAWEYVTGSQEEDTPPVIFPDLRITPDGGVSELLTGTKEAKTDPLWSWTRIPSAASTLLFCVFNTYYIIDVAIRQWKKDQLEKDEEYLLSVAVTKHITSLAGIENDFKIDASMVHMLEAGFVILFWLGILYNCCQMCCKTGWERWHAVHTVLSISVIELSSFSAMRLLMYIAPKVFVKELSSKLFLVEKPQYGAAVRQILFGVFCFVVGFDAFLTKFRTAAIHFIVHKPVLTFDAFYGAAMFLKQMLGIVELDWIMKRRIYQFVFQGPKEKVSDEDLVKIDIFNSWVAKTIFDRYPGIVAKMSMMITFSDDDIQQMVLTDTKRGKAKGAL